MKQYQFRTLTGGFVTMFCYIQSYIPIPIETKDSWWSTRHILDCHIGLLAELWFHAASWHKVDRRKSKWSDSSLEECVASIEDVVCQEGGEPSSPTADDVRASPKVAKTWKSHLGLQWKEQVTVWGRVVVDTQQYWAKTDVCIAGLQRDHGWACSHFPSTTSPSSAKERALVPLWFVSWLDMPFLWHLQFWIKVKSHTNDSAQDIGETIEYMDQEVEHVQYTRGYQIKTVTTGVDCLPQVRSFNYTCTTYYHKTLVFAISNIQCRVTTLGAE